MESVIHDNALYYQGVMYAVTIQIELDMTQSPWACFKQLKQTLNARKILVVFIFSLHWPTRQHPASVIRRREHRI